MSSAYYELYLKGVFDLVSTMVVKSEVSANAINNWLKAQLYEVDDLTPSSWKYYLNLAGKYHHTDSPMTVKSLDTREDIPFTVEMLKIHRTTRREYTYRSRYYNELVTRYPDQVDLILGILNPIDLDTAISAKDHTILYYDNSLVESGEIDLIPRLQNWVNAFYTRWNVADYAHTESLFAASQMAILFSFMPKQIMNIRLDNCKTDRAHSYHIRQYLTSFGRLDPYLDYLNRKQLLFFYRNIRYLLLNSGKEETFEELVQKVMTDRYFPLAEYTIRNNNETLIDDLYPTVQMRRESINGLSSALGKDVKSVPEVLDLEARLARANIECQNEAELAIPQSMKNSLSSQLATKVLESNVLDKTDAEPFTLTDVIFNHWIYLSSAGLYTTVFTITNPTNGEDLYLTAKEAFVLWLYAYNRARGSILNVVPNIVAKRVKRSVLPTADELRSIVESKYVGNEFIDAALDEQPIIKTCVSVEAFKELCQQIHRTILRHRDLAVYQHHFVTRGQIEQMTDRFYMDHVCELSDHETYQDWLIGRGLDLSEVSDYDLDLLASGIYTHATGADLTVAKSLQDIHTAHIKLMGQLSSYSIQFIQQINTSSLKIEDWTYVRMGDQESKAFDYTRIKLYLDSIQRFDSTVKSKVIQTPSRLDLFNPNLVLNDEVKVRLHLDTTLVGTGTGHYKERLSVVGHQWTAPDKIQLGEFTPNTVAIGYSDIEYVPLNAMFNSISSDSYGTLTEQELNALMART